MHHTTITCDRCRGEIEKKVDMEIETMPKESLYELNLALDLCEDCRDSFKKWWGV